LLLEASRVRINCELPAGRADALQFKGGACAHGGQAFQISIDLLRAALR
jgi:hypothetical protein